MDGILLFTEVIFCSCVNLLLRLVVENNPVTYIMSFNGALLTAAVGIVGLDAFGMQWNALAGASQMKAFTFTFNVPFWNATPCFGSAYSSVKRLDM